MSSRRRGREQALQVLYLIDLSGDDVEKALKLFQTNFDTDPEGFEFVSLLVRGVIAHQSEIDPQIEKFADKWKLSRMPRIDRNLLRMGAFELLHELDTPPAVVLDEAVELAKKYGESKTPAFVNGILDRIYRESGRGV